MAEDPDRTQQGTSQVETIRPSLVEMARQLASGKRGTSILWAAQNEIAKLRALLGQPMGSHGRPGERGGVVGSIVMARGSKDPGGRKVSTRRMFLFQFGEPAAILFGPRTQVRRSGSADLEGRRLATGSEQLSFPLRAASNRRGYFPLINHPIATPTAMPAANVAATVSIGCC